MSTDPYPSLETILAQRPRGLIVDIDGTISPIAPIPAAASVSPACRSALATLVDQLELVAAISGRPAAEARAMVGVPRMVYIGNHGLDRWTAEGVSIVSGSRPYVGVLARSLHEAERRIREPGVVVELKGPTASVHYRLAPDPESAERAILAVLQPLAEKLGLRLVRGRMVVEIQPPVAVNKGTALSDLVAEYGLRGVVYVGDDLTDVDAFAAVRRLRSEGIAGLALGVRSAELSPPVERGADRLVPGVNGVAALLVHLVDLTRPVPSTRGARAEPGEDNWRQGWGHPDHYEEDGS